MNRREVATFLGAAAAHSLSWPLSARGEQLARARRVTVLNVLAADDPEIPARIAAFEAALRELGWRNGGNLRIDYVWGWDSRDRSAGAVIRQIIESRPDLVVTIATPTTLALRDAATDVPVVFIQVSDPVGTGLVASLSRPGGTMTGFTNFEFSMGGKWLELLKEMVPTVQRAAFLFNPATAPGTGQFYFQPIVAASSALNIPVSEVPVHNSDDVRRLLPKLARDSGTGLIVGPDIFTATHRDLIVALAGQHRLPAVYPFRYFATAGGLLSYGSDTTDIYRRSAAYVDRILKGARPADLPVQQPTKFELVINLKAAKALGLDLPPTLLARADEVIE